MKESFESPTSKEQPEGKQFEMSDEDAINQATESLKNNVRRLSEGESELPKSYPSVIEDSIRGEVTDRLPSGALEVTISYLVASGPNHPDEERGSIYWYGPPCERCLGSTWMEVDGKKRGCDVCGGRGVRMTAPGFHGRA